MRPRGNPLPRPAALAAFAALVAGTALAETKTFNAVAFGTQVQVRLSGGETVPLTQPFADQPYFTGSADVSGTVSYKIVVDGEEEAFEREFPAGRSSTFNNFFGRKETIKHLPQLGLPFEGELGDRWTRSMGRVGPFNDTYIPTVHITGSAADDAFRKPKMNGVSVSPVSAFFILQDEVKLLENVVFVGGNHYTKKLAFKLQLERRTNYYGRSVFKFRFGEEDPTMLREMLYTDMLEAVGNPVHKTNFARVYANGTPIGLYILQDESSNKKFITTEFYGKGRKPSKIGYPLDAGTGADFEWVDGPRFPKDPWDAFIGDNNDRVVELSRALHDLNVHDPDAVVEFDKKWFALDVFLKALALQYLTGHWDSYLGQTTNFVVYDDPLESDPPSYYKFYFLDQDFEYTFGMSMNECFNPYGDDYPYQSYKTILNRKWACDPPINLDKEHRAMMDKLLSSEFLVARFEEVITKIVKHMLNPVAMSRRIDSLAEWIRPEVKWDRSVPRIHPPYGRKAVDYAWTIEDFDAGLDSPVFDAEGAQKGGAAWGLKGFVAARAGAVAREFGFEWDEEPRDPPPLGAPVTLTAAARPPFVPPGEGPVEKLKTRKGGGSVLGSASSAAYPDARVLSVVAAAMAACI